LAIDFFKVLANKMGEVQFDPTDQNGNLVSKVEKVVEKPVYRQEYRWRNIFIMAYLHATAVYGLFYKLTRLNSMWTLWYNVLIAICASWGVTAGAHRYWTHRAYKAKTPLRLILMVFQTLTFQNHIYQWARDHRVHHKFTDTDADPHNSKRGFFFSHIGWLMVSRRPEMKEKVKKIDLSDLEADKIVMWQKKHYLWFGPLVSFVLHVLVAVMCFGESWSNAWIARVTAYVITLNVTWILNSGAHMWGMKPYDKHITATDTLVMGICCFGEGWHNYHHTFPWDYKTSELTTYGYNFTIPFIDFFAKIGWAYDLKTVSNEMIKKRMMKSGDGSSDYSKFKDLKMAVESEHSDPIWGWDDQDMTLDERELVTVINPSEKTE